MMKPFAAAALLLAAQGAVAQQPPQQCLPRAQAAQMAVALVPSLIDSLGRACTSHLPAGAFLGNGSRTLAERLRTDTAAVRAAAVTTLLSMTGQAEAAPGQSPEQMINVLTESFTAGIDAPNCRGASELLEALSPLPTANVAQAFSAVLGVAMTRAGQDGPPICRE